MRSVEREPHLDPSPHQSERRIDPVVIDMRTLSSCRFKYKEFTDWVSMYCCNNNDRDVDEAPTDRCASEPLELSRQEEPNLRLFPAQSPRSLQNLTAVAWTLLCFTSGGG